MKSFIINSLPEPDWWEEIINDLHKEVTPTPGKALIQTDYFHLYRFKFRWIFTNQILAQLPYASWKKDTKTYEGRDWFKMASFFLPPNNDPVPNFRWCQTKIEECWKKAGYEYERDKVKESQGVWDGKWVYRGKDFYTAHDKEEPTEEEIRFLKNTEKILTQYKNDYTHTKEIERPIYTKDYLDKMKEERVKYDTDNGVWGVKSPQLTLLGYRQVSITFLHETDKLIHLIERKLDNKRTGYELYNPANITKINDDTLLIRVEREFMSEWYPKALKLMGCWKFQTFPLTKELIENWSKKVYEDGSTVTSPLQSCVFCPSDENDAPGRSDDYSIDSEILVEHDDTKFDQVAFQKWSIARRKEQEKMIAKNMLSRIMDKILGLLTNPKELKRNVSDKDLSNVETVAKEYEDIGLDNAEADTVKEVRARTKSEFARRDLVRKEYQETKKGLEEEKQQKEETIRKYDTQVKNIEREIETNKEEIEEIFPIPINEEDSRENVFSLSDKPMTFIFKTSLFVPSPKYQGKFYCGTDFATVTTYLLTTTDKAKVPNYSDYPNLEFITISNAIIDLSGIKDVEQLIKNILAKKKFWIKGLCEFKILDRLQKNSRMIACEVIFLLTLEIKVDGINKIYSQTELI